VVIGDGNPGNVTIALELVATSFVDENIDTPSLLKELELVAVGEPAISVSIFKQMLGHCSARACQETAASPAVGEAHVPETQGQGDRLSTENLRGDREVHAKAILQKIQVKNRTQAALWALNRQTVTEPLDTADSMDTRPVAKEKLMQAG
jgi:two-component system nitrate/nitrite response regulator NarL